MKTSATIKLIANALAYEKNDKAKTQSAGRELIRLAGKVEELERSAMLAALPDADAVDGVGNLAREGEGGSESKISDHARRILQAAESDSYLRHVLKAFTADDGAVNWEKAFPAVAVTMSEQCLAMGEIIQWNEKREAAIEEQVDRMAKANPDIARIIEAHSADGRVDWQAALLEAAMRLDRQSADAGAENDLTLAYMAGAERGRDVVFLLRARIDELAEVYEERCMAYDAAAAKCGKGETVSARQAWRWRSDLAFEIAENLNRLTAPAQNTLQAAGKGPSVDFQGAGDTREQVSDKSQPAADLGRFTGCPEIAEGQNAAAGVLEALERKVQAHETNGASRAALGSCPMPDGYALMANPADGTFYWLRLDGAESLRYYSRWEAWHSASLDSILHRPALQLALEKAKKENEQSR